MDPYVYPGTNVLRNLRDIRDPARLSKFEVDMTTRRLGELEHKMPFTLSGMETGEHSGSSFASLHSETATGSIGRACHAIRCTMPRRAAFSEATTRALKRSSRPRSATMRRAALANDDR